MIFMCEWKIRNGEALEAATKRSQENSEPLAGIKYLAKWYDGTNGGYSLLETDSSQALHDLLYYWADLLDCKVVPVVEAEI